MGIQEKVLKLRKRVSGIKRGVAQYEKKKKISTYNKVRDGIDKIYQLMYQDADMGSVVGLYEELGGLSQELERIKKGGE